MVTVTKNRKSLLLIFCVLIPHIGLSQTKATETQSSKDPSAIHYKELGDQYVSKEKFREAADAYGQALVLGREQFKLDDRVRMAIYISWEDRLNTAADELRRVIVK